MPPVTELHRTIVIIPKDLVDHLQRSRARVIIVRGDVSNASEVAEAVRVCRAVVSGSVVHAAMVLVEIFSVV